MRAPLQHGYGYGAHSTPTDVLDAVDLGGAGMFTHRMTFVTRVCVDDEILWRGEGSGLSGDAGSTQGGVMSLKSLSSPGRERARRETRADWMCARGGPWCEGDAKYSGGPAGGMRLDAPASPSGGNWSSAGHPKLSHRTPCPTTGDSGARRGVGRRTGVGINPSAAAHARIGSACVCAMRGRATLLWDPAASA
ncbi:hypothetical protein B0H19DRAFT_80399 [Mycena capillaripes]|nr:hypothetical protein B0H19DRAFT_80399 [Mycena capillaripes]